MDLTKILIGTIIAVGLVGATLFNNEDLPTVKSPKPKPKIVVESRKMDPVDSIKYNEFLIDYVTRYECVAHPWEGRYGYSCNNGLEFHHHVYIVPELRPKAGNVIGPKGVF